jgi:hypothetical protein
MVSRLNGVLIGVTSGVVSAVVAALVEAFIYTKRLLTFGQHGGSWGSGFLTIIIVGAVIGGIVGFFIGALFRPRPQAR